MSVKQSGFAGLVEPYPVDAHFLPTREIDEHGRWISWELRSLSPKWTSPKSVSRVRHQIYSMITARREADMYRPLSIALTLLSLETSLAHEKKVIVFAPCSTMSLRVQEGLAPKTDLVAFLASRRTAHKVIEGARPPPISPAAHEVVAITEVSNSKEPSYHCLRNMALIAQNRPSSACQYGIAITKRYFRALAIGLDYTMPRREVEWHSETCVEKLYALVKRIRDEAFRSIRPQPAIPRLNCVLRTDRTLLAMYYMTTHGRRYDLFPLFVGRDPSRKPFVALASCGEHLKHARIFKYSWRHLEKPNVEYEILKKIQNAPGVIQLDDELCSSRADYDSLSGSVRSILATKVAGSPLSSCRSFREFLEAMYDLLEVLRYLAQEKKILHRDVNWRNVLLVRPEDAPQINHDIFSRETNEPIKHKYRFISNIYNEEKIRVRIALSDFEQALDLNTGKADAMSSAMITGMFMTQDNPANGYYRSLHLLDSLPSDGFKTDDRKYDEIEERTSWDTFYSNIDRLISGLPTDPGRPGRDKVLTKGTLQFSAAHDAESVFYLCMLFFCRAKPKQRTTEKSGSKGRQDFLFSLLIQKHLEKARYWNSFIAVDQMRYDGQGHSMLNLVARYLQLPWGALDSTARGGRYEFHLHDLLQRVILNELIKMREQNDDILIEDLPTSIEDTHPYISYAFRGVPGDLTTLVRKWQKKGSVEKRVGTTLGKRKREEDGEASKAPAVSQGGPTVDKSANSRYGRSGRCPEEFADFLKFKKAENCWLTCFSESRRAIAQRRGNDRHTSQT